MRDKESIPSFSSAPEPKQGSDFLDQLDASMERNVLSDPSQLGSPFDFAEFTDPKRIPPSPVNDDEEMRVMKAMIIAAHRIAQRRGKIRPSDN